MPVKRAPVQHGDRPRGGQVGGSGSMLISPAQIKATQAEKNQRRAVAQIFLNAPCLGYPWEITNYRLPVVFYAVLPEEHEDKSLGFTSIVTFQIGANPVYSLEQNTAIPRRESTGNPKPWNEYLLATSFDEVPPQSLVIPPGQQLSFKIEWLLGIYTPSGMTTFPAWIGGTPGVTFQESIGFVNYRFVEG